MAIRDSLIYYCPRLGKFFGYYIFLQSNAPVYHWNNNGYYDNLIDGRNLKSPFPINNDLIHVDTFTLSRYT